MKDENYWESEGWRILCNQTIGLCLRHSESLLDALDAGSGDMGAPVEQFIERIVQALAERVKTDHSGLWQTALSLFGDTRTLKQRLLQDPALQPKRAQHPGGGGESVAPEQGLRQKLRDYLNDSKRQLQPHRANVWPRLNRISMSVFDAGTDTHRCTPEHFVAVCRHIRSRHAKDHNLPRTYDTVEAYFLEFCSDCRERFIDHELLGADDLGLLPDIEAELLPALEHCLQALQTEQTTLYETLDAVFRFGSVIPISKKAYCEARGLSRRQLERRQQQALTLLRECLQTRLMEGAPRWL